MLHQQAEACICVYMSSHHFATNLCKRTSLHSSCISLMVLRAPLLRCMRSKGTMSTTCCVGGNVVLRSQIRRAKSTKAMPRRCKNWRHWLISCGIRVTCWMRWNTTTTTKQTSLWMESNIVIWCNLYVNVFEFICHIKLVQSFVHQ